MRRRPQVSISVMSSVCLIEHFHRAAAMPLKTLNDLPGRKHHMWRLVCFNWADPEISFNQSILFVYKPNEAIWELQLAWSECAHCIALSYIHMYKCFKPAMTKSPILILICSRQVEASGVVNGINLNGTVSLESWPHCKVFWHRDSWWAMSGSTEASKSQRREN